MWCWHCCHEIEGEALSLPYKYDQMRNKFSTMGKFCSWSCMKTFNIDKNGINRGGVIACNIVIMRKKLFGVIGPIHGAPSRYSLKEFGGPLSIDEFRQNSTVDVGPRIEEIVTENVQNVVNRLETIVNSTKLYQITDAKGTNEPLRLKRPKPLKRDENNLEKTLGITRKKVTTLNS